MRNRRRLLVMVIPIVTIQYLAFSYVTIVMFMKYVGFLSTY